MIKRGYGFEVMVRWFSRHGNPFAVHCALPIQVQIGSADYGYYRTVIIQVLVFRFSYSWLNLNRAER